MRNRGRAGRYHAERLDGRRLLAAVPLTLTAGAGANTAYLRQDADHLHLDV